MIQLLCSLSLQQMKEIDRNADNFKYVLVIKKDGITTSYEISDWTVTQKEIDFVHTFQILC